MGRIKSALEIAMEKTEAVKGDRASIDLYAARQQGKRLANRYLAGEISSLGGGEKSKEGTQKDRSQNDTPPEEDKAIRRGCFDVFISQITLPVVPEDLKRLETLGRGLAEIIGHRGFSQLYQQYLSAVSQYLNEAAQYEEAVKRQYAPKLRQKEEDLARRIGRHIKLDPFQDPEFVAFYTQNMNALKANYEGLADQVREQARLLFGEE
ncbi:MAG: hypothetical protein LBE02_02785 [Spirochaetaceae bacterium]|jgi:hypothetical protein|nr:hypothetical protein [Spirochaetaceae bacterium]